MGNPRVSVLHLVFFSMFLVATEYTCFGTQNSTRSCHEQERQALLEFKHSVDDECGVLSSWVGTNCCSWKGVRCHGATGNVVGLHLRRNQGDVMENYYDGECYLVGDTVITYVSELRHLKHLDLSGNNFQGSQIPEFVGSFKQLSYLNLSHARFSGIIPHHIGNLSNLKVLDLGSNYYFSQGLIANDVTWVSGLSSLNHLDLTYVDLSQAKNIDMVFHIIPSLTYLSLSECELSNVDQHLNSSKILPNIQHLDLGFNNFEGQLPHFLQNMTSLTFLDLSSYNLSLAWKSLQLLSTIPSLLELHLSECGLHNTHFSPTYLNFSALPNIQYLDLRDNSIRGKFPPELMNITSLTVLLLSYNSLNSSIPVMPNLLKLDVSYNNFESVELVGIWRQCHLKELSLSTDYLENEMIGPSSNTSKCSQYALEMLHLKLDNFNGLILESLGRLTNLRELSLWGYNLTGSIPESLGRITNLRVLALQGDDLTVSILESLGRLTDLRVLQLQGISLKDSVPGSLGRLTNLRVLALQGNDLTVSILESLGRLTKLRVLRLEGNSLKDSVAEALGRLANLRVLAIQGNDLTVSILESLGRLANLRVLQLEGISLKDSVPESLGRLTNLRVLKLMETNLTGLIPESIGRLTNLRVFHLFYNSLSCSIPESLGRLTNLRDLQIWGNSFTGSIPESIGRLTNLRDLQIWGSNLSGSIPESLGRLTNLRDLQIGGNNLTGSIPESLGSLTNLRVLELTSNSLTGPIPKALGRLRSLENLDLSHNDLTGSIPESFGRLICLKRLFLQSNRLTSAIPTSLGRLESLEYLDLSANLLTSLPVSIGQLSKLVDFDLSDNSLEGEVSEAHFANLSMLENLITSSNYKLIFNFSHEWIPPFQLRTVFLNSCNITNGFPRWFQTQKWLERLVLSNASIHGVLPTGLWKMPMLDELNLSHNNLSGSLTNLRFSEYTGYLLLHDNFFNGSLPRSLCQSTRLRHLDVSSNRLSGNIPDCVENLQKLAMLILSSNGLTGVLPSSLGNIVSLEWLKLNDNNFSGELPPGLGNLRSLMVMDLGDNEFSGNIPLWIGENLKHLKILRLHKNSFTGCIPQSLCKFPHLHILDIAHNNIRGSIPHCFGNLSGMIHDRKQDFEEGMFSDDGIMVQFINVMQVMKGMDMEYTKTMRLVVNMDLSSNKLTGEIPPEVTALVLLMGLNLSHNHLSGSIPDRIGNMKALNSLDLSDNQLTGTIPQSLAALNFLSSMNLSHNNLSGRIPTGNQLQTLTDPSIYAGNRDLCGAPLLNNCSNHENPPTTKSKKKPNNFWFYLDITCGFATGFWGVIGVLSLKKQWRRKLFLIAKAAMDKVHVMVAVRVSKMKRGGEAK